MPGERCVGGASDPVSDWLCLPFDAVFVVPGGELSGPVGTVEDGDDVLGGELGGVEEFCFEPPSACWVG